VRALGSEQLREALVGYGFVALPIASFLIFFMYPLGYAFYISYFEWGALGKIDSVGLGNYRDIFDDFLFGKALKNTLYYAAVVVPAQMALGLGLAVIVNNAIRFRTFFRAAFYFPSVAGSIAITAVAAYILSADGLLNAGISALSGDEYNRPWFGNSDTALESIMALNVWTTSGTMMLFYLASLQSIPTDVYEAAAIDGAGAWRTLWMVGLPLAKNGLVVVIIVNFVTAWGEYLLCSTLTNDQAVRTMPVVLAAAQGGMGQWAWPRIAAVYVIVVVPGIVAFAFAQKLFFKGLMEGALKS
jgi:ABC-type sugar transport system permease subunit